MSARVLVVDDLAPNVKLLSAKLTREYFDVVTAMNGHEAIERARHDAPDIVLLDVMMPGMDGFEVCEHLKRDPETAHIPVVMVTALSDSVDRVRGLEAGADDFLTKPVNDIALFARVRSLVRLKMTMDEWRVRENTSRHLGIGEAGEGLEDADRGKVVVIEDHSVDRNKVIDALEHDNHEGQFVAPDDAVEKAAGWDAELVIISLGLIDQDGLRLVSHLRSHERTRQVPILLIGDETQMERIAKGLELGANDYVLRPIDRNELRARAKTQVRRRRYQERLRATYLERLNMAHTDSLTGLYNRRYLMAHLDKAMSRIGESRRSIGLLILDIDRFKLVNDTHGHGIGDQVLAEFADRLQDNVRTFDLVCRLGGEEFVVLMPDVTVQTMSHVAERLRARIERDAFETDAGALSITTSIGGAASFDRSELPEDLLKRSDAALYQAKGSGRNRVMLHEDLQGDQSAAVG